MKQPRRQKARSVSILAIMGSEDDFLSLQNILRTAKWPLTQAHDYGEASCVLKQSAVPVVICDGDLPSSHWKDVLRDFHQFPKPPQLVVTSRLGDEALWAEVLNMGGFDVLVQPFDHEEVTRVIGAAWRRFENESQRSKSRRQTRTVPMTLTAAS